jgi:D-alanine-D-alanine ligase
VAGTVVLLHAAEMDRPDDVDTEIQVHAVSAALVRLGYDAQVERIGLDLSRLEGLFERRPTAVFNLVEAIHGDARLALAVPIELERLGIPYSGSRADALLQLASKTATKRAMRAYGLSTPDWWCLGEPVPPNVTVIVKSDHEHASLGLDSDSVVAGSKAAGEVGRRSSRFGGRFFAEAFVDGREMNVAVLEESDGFRVLPISEILFEDYAADRPRIVDYEAKWVEGSFAYRNTPRRFGLEQSEPELANFLAARALACVDLFGLRGYARVDFRVNGDGEAWILEANANPCLSPDAGFVASAAQAGFRIDDVVAHIVQAALSFAPARRVSVRPQSGPTETLGSVVEAGVGPGLRPAPCGGTATRPPC